MSLQLVVDNSAPKLRDFTKRYKRGAYVPRPYRVLDSRTKKNVRYLCYTYAGKAVEGASKAALWTPMGRTLEVYDCRNGKLLATFKVHLGKGGKRTVTSWVKNNVWGAA